VKTRGLAAISWSLWLAAALPAGAKDPAGLRIRSKDQSRRLLIAWGDTVRSAGERITGRATNTGHERGLPPPKEALPCVDGQHEEEVICRVGGWLADFGAADEEFNPTALSFYRDKFYGYVLDFDAEAYELALRTFSAELGEPTEVKSLPVQNAFGATYSRDWALWEKPTFSVLMIRRIDKVDDGKLTITYKPFEPPASARERGNERAQAPF
jgi:hypothetical protein